MKTGIYKPFVKDGELWGKEVNPYKEPEIGRDLLFDIHDTSIESQYYHEQRHKRSNQYYQTEKQLKEFKVDEAEYELGHSGLIRLHKDGNTIVEYWLIEAELDEKNELINLKIV